MSGSLQPKNLPNALILGNDIFFPAIFSGNQPYVFKQKQIEFLYYLQQLKQVHAAALAVGETEEWAQKFLGSRKFKSFRDKKLQEMSVRSGLTIEWWHQWGKWCAEGTKENYEAECKTCQRVYEFTEYEIETQRDDNMQMHVQCPVCFAPLEPAKKTEVFKPTREQVEAWKEIGSRLSPKIERVHHQFENSEIVFESTGGTE